ncbi:MAG: hypothetical protein IPO65_01180 [Saprospiraceae bacterium]|nr:hypothetical protein [Saprospiraceae bacterium]
MKINSKIKYSHKKEMAAATMEFYACWLCQKYYSILQIQVEDRVEHTTLNFYSKITTLSVQAVANWVDEFLLPNLQAATDINVLMDRKL